MNGTRAKHGAIAASIGFRSKKMKKKTEKRDRSDGLRREYDLSQLKEGVRGKYAARYCEDEKTLAAIDEGIRDAKAGRTVPIDKVRKLLRQWISDSSTKRS